MGIRKLMAGAALATAVVVGRPWVIRACRTCSDLCFRRQYNEQHCVRFDRHRLDARCVGWVRYYGRYWNGWGDKRF